MLVFTLNLPNSGNFEMNHSPNAMSDPFKYKKAANKSIVAVEKIVVAGSEWLLMAESGPSKQWVSSSLNDRY